MSTAELDHSAPLVDSTQNGIDISEGVDDAKKASLIAKIDKEEPLSTDSIEGDVRAKLEALHKDEEGVDDTKKASLIAKIDKEEPLSTDSIEGDIHAKLKALHKDEVVALTQNPTNRRTAFYNRISPHTEKTKNYIAIVVLETSRYVKWVLGTWWHFVASAVFGGLGLFDLFSAFFFAAGGTFALGLVLIFCLIMHLPFLVHIYYSWSDKTRGGLGLVNSANPNIFQSLTKAQSDAAKAALSAPISETKDKNPETERHFNYDISKMLLQLAAVVYEHENDAIRKAVDISGPPPSYFVVPTPPNAQFNATSGASKAIYPRDVEIHSAQTTLDNASANPGTLSDAVLSRDAAVRVTNALDESNDDTVIHQFCKKYGVEFAPVSQLNDTSSAFCAFFWDPTSNWIVVAFKGTAPIEFSEWMSDLDAKLHPVGSFIDGFSKVHKGFKDRVFPEDLSPGRRPYDTISLALRTLAKSLRKQRSEGTEINVWVTGHSLGCATASLVYSRFLMRPWELGKKSILRDAYLFAAPIVADRPSVDVFNAKMASDPDRPKTMWRITSNRDIVATGLPEFGDYRSVAVSPNNSFAYAHLGTEIILRNHPAPSNVTGNHVVRGAVVRIDSVFTHDQIMKQRKQKYEGNSSEGEREVRGILLQKIPILGRLFAHFTVYYWDQLDRIALDPCSWVIN